MRYSPDGRSLSIQNPSGIYLFSREPLKLQTYIAAEDLYPLRFSSDSQAISVIGYGLKLNREKVPGGPRLEQRELPFQDSCLDAEFSPGADFFACLLPDSKLVVYQLSTNQFIFSDFLEDSPQRVNFVPLDFDTAFPGPFGYRLANDLSFLAGRGMKFLSMSFSPDSKILLVQRGSEAFSVDLRTRRKTSLPGPLHKILRGSFCLQDDGRILIASREKESGPVLMSLKSGEILATPSFKADAVRLARNPRYALLSDSNAIGNRVFDVQQNRQIPVPDNLSIDIFANEMAVLDAKGILFLYHIGQELPFLSTDLPLDALPVLRAAAVSPSLDRIAFSVDGNGAVFETATGNRLYSSPRFSSANFSDPSSVYLFYPKDRSNAPRVSRVNLSTGNSSPVWSGENDHLHPGGTVLFDYEFDYSPGNVMGRGHAFSTANDIPFRLRALDPVTGTELWKREFPSNGPVPFADPQDDRLILAWVGNSEGAEVAAKHIPEVWRVFKKAKPTKLDTYFEVLDARSGKALGGVLVQQGGGPYSFDAAFSAGDALFLVKDGRRVSVRSLQDGSLRAQLLGVMPTANSRSNLFAVMEGPGSLLFYDLATGAKLGQHVFPNPISYLHFSADGNNLLVLTSYQMVYILDAASFRHGSTPAY
ncbi:MAG: hypothetical protein ACRD51_11045, partial [Candidatus Acidiferrum sp.]